VVVACSTYYTEIWLEELRKTMMELSIAGVTAEMRTKPSRIRV
jgi:hypothetical protein